jgi:bacterioferritin-associated ferredoxin
MYVCLCTGMNCRQVKQAVAEGARSTAQVFLRNGLRPNCGRCRDTIVEMLDAAAPAEPAGDWSLPPLATGLAAAE